MPVSIFKLSETPTWQVAAHLLSTTAYPAANETDLRQETFDLLGAGIIRRSEGPIDLASASDRQIGLAENEEAIGKRFFGRMQHRANAGAVALPQALNEMSGPIAPPRGVKHISHRALVQRALELGWYNDRSDFRKRAWKPALSVLHLLLSLRLVENRRLQAGEAWNDGAFFHEPNLLTEVISFAEPLESVVLNLWGNQIGADDIWRFRLAA